MLWAATHRTCVIISMAKSKKRAAAALWRRNAKDYLDYYVAHGYRRKPMKVETEADKALLEAYPPSKRDMVGIKAGWKTLWHWRGRRLHYTWKGGDPAPFDHATKTPAMPDVDNKYHILATPDVDTTPAVYEPYYSPTTP